jgi:hypothetical protein
MMKLMTACALASCLIVAAPVGAQQAGAAPKPAMVPLEVSVVLARYQGDRKISSIPYTLNVNANGNPTSLNMSTEVPVPSTIFQPGSNGQATNSLRSYNYRPIGTNFNLRASTLPEGGFEVQLVVEDSSVFNPDVRQQNMPMMPDVPAFRSFKGTNSLLLKDGQTRQYTVATDRVTGEVLKVDVTLKVLK